MAGCDAAEAWWSCKARDEMSNRSEAEVVAEEEEEEEEEEEITRLRKDVGSSRRINCEKNQIGPE